MRPKVPLPLKLSVLHTMAASSSTVVRIMSRSARPAPPFPPCADIHQAGHPVSVLALAQSPQSC